MKNPEKNECKFKCFASDICYIHCPCTLCHSPKPEGKCKDCQFEGNDHSFECPQYVETLPPEVSPEKKEEKCSVCPRNECNRAEKEKECECECHLVVGHKKNEDHSHCTPTLTERKGEWLSVFQDFHKNDHSLGSAGWNVAPSTVEIFIRGLLAQKEQAVKVEMREMIKEMNQSGNYTCGDAGCCCGKENLIINLLSLLSDKVNH